MVGLVMLARLYRITRVDDGPKFVLVTGCANGLGKATVEALIKQGDFVVGSDVDQKALQQLAESHPTRFKALKPFDVASAESVAMAAEELRLFSGKQCLDAIVNNAGIIRGGPLVELADKDMAAIININILGMFLVTKYFYPLLRNDPTSRYRPRIINLGSEISYAGLSAAFNGPYAMTKFAVEAYSTSLRQELSLLPLETHVVVINPGPHESGMTKKSDSKFGDAAAKSQSMFAAVSAKAEPIAQAYMDRFSKPASNVANAICTVVHWVHPPRRFKVNVTTQMELMRYAPQSVLDVGVKAVMKA